MKWRRTLGVALAVCLCLPASVAAQQDASILQGQLVSRLAGVPLEGALVRLIDGDGEEHDAGLSGPEGSFRFSADATGRFRVRVQRIGLDTWTSPAFELRAGEVRRRTFRVPERPVQLDELDVSVESACDLEPGEAAAVERAWNEVRKALERTSLGEREARYRFKVLDRKRTLDPRTLRDMEGVFWSDASTGALESLEYAYTGLRGRPEDERAGSGLRFGRLPDGAWYVRSWTIRLPVYGETELQRDLGTRGALGRGRGLRAVYEVGGEVTEVRGPDGRLLVSGETATTDSTGRFRLPEVPPGRYRVTVRHPFLSVLGVSVEPTPWEAVAGNETHVDLSSPDVAAVLRSVCGEDAEALIAGRVLGPGGGAGLEEATVRAAWSEAGLEGDAEVVRRRRFREAASGQDGVHRLCLPSSGTYRLTARREGLPTTERRVEVTAERRVLEVDLQVSRAEGDRTPRWSGSSPVEPGRSVRG